MLVEIMMGSLISPNCLFLPENVINKLVFAFALTSTWGILKYFSSNFFSFDNVECKKNRWCFVIWWLRWKKKRIKKDISIHKFLLSSVAPHSRCGMIKKYIKKNHFPQSLFLMRFSDKFLHAASKLFFIKKTVRYFRIILEES